jgi:hypothetical protein
MEFRTWLEANNVSSLVLLEIHGSSSGHYGFGDMPERAAPDPRGCRPEWRFSIEPKDPKVQILNQLLAKHPIVMMEHERGSYHERFLDAFVFVTIPTLIDYQLEDQEIFLPHASPPDRSTRRRGEEAVLQFQYSSLDDVIERIVKNLNYDPPPEYEHLADLQHQSVSHKSDFEYAARPGESREDYWARIMAQTVARMPKKYSGD